MATTSEHVNMVDDDVVILDDESDDDDDDDVRCDLFADNCEDVLEDIREVGKLDASIMDVRKLQTHVQENSKLRLLFKNHLMEPLTFLLLLHDFAMELKLTKLIEECGGVVYSSLNEMDGHTIVMVKDDSLHCMYSGVLFKVSYIQACIAMEKVLNISTYFKSSCKPRLQKNFNYMSVIYFKKYSWDSIPEKFNCSKQSPQSPLKTAKPKADLPPKKLCQIIFSSDEEDEGEDRSKMPPPLAPVAKQPTIVNKHSRMLYSKNEQDAILKFIVHKEGYNNVKGNVIWKKMESRKICPARTWQSMKEHFSKKIVYNLNNFSFLTQKQIDLLQVCALRKH